MPALNDLALTVEEREPGQFYWTLLEALDNSGHTDLHDTRDTLDYRVFRSAAKPQASLLQRPGPGRCGAPEDQRVATFCVAVADAAEAVAAGTSHVPPIARIRPTAAWYCADFTCSAWRRLRSSLRRASSRSSWLM
jgi:hypothetical protein